MEVTESRRTKPRERDPGDLLHLNYLPESCRKEAESGVQGGPQAYSWKEGGRGGWRFRLHLGGRGEERSRRVFPWGSLLSWPLS